MGLGGGLIWHFHLGRLQMLEVYGSMSDIKVAIRFISSYLTFGECTDEVSEGFGKVIPKPKGSGCLCITLPNRSNSLALCCTQRTSFGGRAPAGEGCYSRRTRWRGSWPHISAMSSSPLGLIPIDFNPLPSQMKSFPTSSPRVQGRTPLHWTAMVGRCSTAELLLANGAEVDALDFGHLASRNLL